MIVMIFGCLFLGCKVSILPLPILPLLVVVVFKLLLAEGDPADIFRFIFVFVFFT